MIATAIISAVGALGSLAASTIGAVKSARAGQGAISEIRKAHNSAQDKYNSLLGQDYVNRTEIQQLLKKNRDLFNDGYKRARATNLVAGGTDESLARMQQQSNSAIADATASAAANASAYKDSIRQAQITNDNQYAQQMATAYNAKAQNIANSASLASKAMGSLSDIGANVDKTRIEEEKIRKVRES